MPTKSYLQRIHIAKKALKLSDDAYYAMLSLYEVESSKDLNDAQAQHLLGTFKQLGWEPGKKFNDFGARPNNYATPKQLRYIDALWNGFATNPTPEALRAFCKRITGMSDIKFISKKHASDMIKAISVMKQDKSLMKQALNAHINPIKE